MHNTTQGGGGGGGGVSTKCLDVMNTSCSKRDKDKDHPPPLHLVLYTNCFTSTMKIHHPSNKEVTYFSAFSHQFTSEITDSGLLLQNEETFNHCFKMKKPLTKGVVTCPHSPFGIVGDVPPLIYHCISLAISD